MVAAFDFPDGSIGEPPTPEFVIDYIRGYR